MTMMQEVAVGDAVHFHMMTDFEDEERDCQWGNQHNSMTDWLSTRRDGGTSLKVQAFSSRIKDREKVVYWDATEIELWKDNLEFRA